MKIGKRPIRVVFYASDKPREIMLARALEKGVRSHGDAFETRRTFDYGETQEGDDRKYPGPSPDTDVAVCFGVKGKSRQIVNDHLAVGKSTLFMDKGYSRQSGEGGHTEYSRISVNGSDPLHYFMREDHRSDRWKALEVIVKPRQNGYNGNVLFCGSSLKYHIFHNLDDPTTYAESLFKKLRKLTERHLIYRPKPSWKAARPIGGTSFSNGSTSIAEALRGCHCLVTHGSAAALDAIVNGVPVIVLGGSIAKPVSDTVIEHVEKPFWPDDKLRSRWFNAMAYCQWTTEELRTGEAWDHLKTEILRQAQ